MTSQQFIRWRQLLGFSQAAAARCLGIDARTIATIERTEGSIPERVAVACAGLTTRLLRPEAARELLLEQHSDLAKTVFVVIPCVIAAAGPGTTLLQTRLAEAVAAWMTESMPSARFSLRIVLSPDEQRIAVPVVTFTQEAERVLFQLRWL